MIPLFKVFMAPEAAADVTAVLNSGYIGQGPKVEEFEKLLKIHFQTDNLVTVNSCTSALQLALHMIKDDPGDEVITTPLTCFATTSSILANNLKVRWSDVDPKTCNICLDDVERKLSKNTKAIVVVHWAGYPVDLDRLKTIQDHCYSLYGHRPPVIEDCAHAWGSKYKNKLIGTSGNFCAFSLQAIKHLTAIEGGILICPTNEDHKRAKLLRWFGLDRESSLDYRCQQNVIEAGYKYHMPDVNATVGIANFHHAPSVVQRHQENSAFYDRELQNIPGITLLQRNPNYQSSCWVYTMMVKNRDEFKEAMTAKGVHVSQVHARNDTYDCTEEFICRLPSLDKIDQEMISIPCGWWVTDEDRAYVVELIKNLSSI